jgi:predicted esterase
MKSKPLLRSFVVFVAFLLAACGGGGGGDTTPPPASAGDLVRSNSVSAPAGAAGAGEVLRFDYRMPAVNGGLTEARALLLVPAGTPPTGGWPVVAYGHGTTGLADACAPSGDPQFGGEGATLGAILALGAAVVAPDYEGLGTAGEHPYLHLQSAARSMVYAVVAARALRPSALATRWAAVGYSQGGHAALATAQYAQQLAPQLQYRATVAFAPASSWALTTQTSYARVDTLAAAGNLTAAAQQSFEISYYAALTVQGAHAVDPGLPLSAVLLPRLAALAPLAATETACGQFVNVLVGDYNAYLGGGGDPREYPGLRRDWATRPEAQAFQALAASNEPGASKLATPLFLAQGALDTTVPQVASDALNARLVGNGSTVRYRIYANADHASIVPQAANDAAAFLTPLMQ